jgi:hypothetical protein
MDKGFWWALACAFLLVASAAVTGKVSLLSIEAGAAAAPATSPAPPAAAAKEACLDCHGPFEKLASDTAGYQAPSGEKLTPHLYVPHSSKEAKSIPACDNCHVPHAVPPTDEGLKDLPKQQVQWCYATCHHENNFKSCKGCHDEPK